MKNILVYAILSFIICFICGLILIPILRRFKIGQPILKYVKSHESKSGTPTMGGLFFILPSVIVFLVLFGVQGRLALVSVTIGIAFLIVGFIDDFIKIKFSKNEGLKPYQKILFMVFIALLAGAFTYVNGLTVFFIPFTSLTVNLGIFSVLIVAIIFIAVTNSVNLTDGLDGLSASVSLIYLISLLAIIIIQKQQFDYLYVKPKEYEGLILLIASLIGGILAFLIFNIHPAKVFMGDTGSLSLGGIIGAISIFSSNSFYIPILGIMFVISSLSVIIQVAYYKKTKKRVFLMAPFHHHLQLKGISEERIRFYYLIISALMGVICVIFYI